MEEFLIPNSKEVVCLVAAEDKHLSVYYSFLGSVCHVVGGLLYGGDGTPRYRIEIDRFAIVEGDCYFGDSVFRCCEQHCLVWCLDHPLACEG